MASSRTGFRPLLRLRVILVGMMCGFAVLVVSLWRIQVVDSLRYRDRLRKQSVRRVRIPGWRGKVFDRHGVCLADNRPSYCLAIYVEELRKEGGFSSTRLHVGSVIGRLAERLHLAPAVSTNQIARHIRSRLPLPLLAWRDLNETNLARWAESGVAIPGVGIYVEPVRVYPQGRLAAHVLGHVGRAERRFEGGEGYDYYLPDMEGKRGVERAFNHILAGEAGGKLHVVDASGFTHESMEFRAPRAGRDLFLTLDARIQQAVERVLVGERGAGVVLDPRNGDVLALASSPSFNPNSFHPRMPPPVWRALLDDSRRPLLNRAVSGVYPPGSVFKPVVAIAALENRRARESTAFDCPGYFTIGSVSFKCWRWRHGGHGRLDMVRALEQSCNPYFCQLGLQCGYERIDHMAAALGFGARTGIELESEKAGLVPNGDWKRRHNRGGWSGGDTCNVSIGQGALLATPIQLAVYAATLANGGTVYRPRLVRDPDRPAGEIVNTMKWSATTLSVLRKGLYAVVQSPQGTGKNARVEGIAMGGKTGTAEYGPKAEDKKHTWMIAFAPFGAPRYAVVLLVEDGESGGKTVAPRVRTLMTHVLSLEPMREAAPVQGEA